MDGEAWNIGDVLAVPVLEDVSFEALGPARHRTLHVFAQVAHIRRVPVTGGVVGGAGPETDVYQLAVFWATSWRALMPSSSCFSIIMLVASVVKNDWRVVGHRRPTRHLGQPAFLEDRGGVLHAVSFDRTRTRIACRRDLLNLRPDVVVEPRELLYAVLNAKELASLRAPLLTFDQHCSYHENAPQV